MSLSDMQCKVAKPLPKQYKLFDGEGLYLLIMPNGSKYWRLKYRIFGKEKVIAVGIYPTITLAKAREEKGKLKQQISQGIDPVLTAKINRETARVSSVDTLEGIALEWYEKNLPVWDPRYAATVLHRLNKYIFPFLGAFPIQSIKPILILSCLQRVEKTAPEMARRIKSYLSNIFIYAVATSRADIDMTTGLEKALLKYKKKHFASISVDELPALLNTIFNHKARMTRQTFLAIRLMLLTFVRTSELVLAKWTELDFDKKMWVIPDERMKKDFAHMVPLSNQTISILKELKDISAPSEYLFPGTKSWKTHMSKGTILMALKRMGYKGKMTGHGFRSLALGILKEKLGYSHEVADRQLAHVPKSETDRAYDRAKFLPQRIKMMQEYADYLDKVFIEELSNRLET